MSPNKKEGTEGEFFSPHFGKGGRGVFVFIEAAVGTDSDHEKGGNVVLATLLSLFFGGIFGAAACYAVINRKTIFANLIPDTHSPYFEMATSSNPIL
jgi:hypothetical protein